MLLRNHAFPILLACLLAASCGDDEPRSGPTGPTLPSTAVPTAPVVVSAQDLDEREITFLFTDQFGGCEDDDYIGREFRVRFIGGTPSVWDDGQWHELEEGRDEITYAKTGQRTGTVTLIHIFSFTPLDDPREVVETSTSEWRMTFTAADAGTFEFEGSVHRSRAVEDWRISGPCGGGVDVTEVLARGTFTTAPI